MVQPGSPLPIFPHSEGLRRRIWWGAGSNYSAEQIARYRAAWKEAGHSRTPRVSVSRSIFLLLTIPNQLGFKESLSIISNFAKYVAPELGWIPADQGLPTGYPID